MKTFVQCALFIFIGGAVLIFGSRWDSTAMPTHAIVYTRSGEQLEGLLWTDLRGGTNLKTGDGFIHNFAADDHRISAIVYPIFDKGTDWPLLKHWRVMLPISLWCLLFLFSAIGDVVNVADYFRKPTRI